ncbi:unnamed protein product [Rangifer tarandus platyrhynchus]|uniref:Uncharacterized protein n=1 Tax=Rangifer tarandus platyrhynchus TaxID=3082113 RepID=A0AC59YJU7_RANTA
MAQAKIRILLLISCIALAAWREVPPAAQGPVSSEQEKEGKQRVSGGPENTERRKTCSEARGQRAQQRPSRDRRPEALRRQRGAFGRGQRSPRRGELSVERWLGPPQTGRPETETEVKPGGGEQEGTSVGGAVPASAPGRRRGREQCVCAAAGSEHRAPALCRRERKAGLVVRA